MLTKPLHDRAVVLITGHNVDRQIGLTRGESCREKIVFATRFVFVVIADKTDDARPSHFRLKPRGTLEKVKQNMGICFAGRMLNRVDEINGIDHCCLGFILRHFAILSWRHGCKADAHALSGNQAYLGEPSMSTPYILRSYDKLLRLPFGRQIFSIYAARKAPYFRTIRPLVQKLEAGHCEIALKKRRSVQNHIGTVHVIAVANGLEMAMGFLAEATIPRHLRWIPKGMELTYPAKADTDLICEALSDPADWVPGNLPIKVIARRRDGTPVVEGVINLWISEKQKR